MHNTIVQPNDILLNITGASIGRSAIVPSDFDIANVNQHVSIIRLIDTQLAAYIHKVLISNFTQMIIRTVQVGAAQEGLPAEKQKELIVPLPPLAEQHRIVSAIKSAFAVIGEIECNNADLQTTVTVAKSKILSLAIQGKLVPQDPKDEPASVLLERIRTEREALIKAGKIKRNKNETTITRSSDNSYYEKISLGEVCKLLNTPETIHGKLPYLEVRYLRRSISPDYKESGRYLENRTPVILVDGENSGEVFFTPERGYMGSTFRELLVFSTYDVEFVLLFISYYQKKLRENKTGSAIPHLNKKLLAELPLPLMSLNQQRETVKNVKKQFEQLNKIVENLN
jgi:type I restriction enzyme S subunit